ncbi:unnamed protein product [Paramecium sonneborni]|uniref:Uncharacterized protein n=1 Tax=Paramecium sonneborni TaxID=65129 RepID=A0A8S1KHQ7_9CILI|nr:unnamed protein product [Paramecium sonneborni]
MIIKNNEQRASIIKSNITLVSPVRKSSSIFLTTSNQNIMSFKEISPKQQELNRVLNFNINHSQSANSSMYSIEQAPNQNKIKNRVNLVDISSKFLQLDEEIIEVYNEFEKNYRSINQLEKLEPISYQTNQYLEVKRKSKNQLIQTQDDLIQSDLMHGDQNRIKINRFKFNYYRMKLRGKVSPIHVFFNIPDRVQTSSLKIFLSTKAEFPTKFNAEYNIHSRFAKIYSEKNQHYFSEEYLFITLYSEVDFEFSISFSFGNSSTIKSPIKQQLEPSEEIQDTFPLTHKIQPKDKIIGNLQVAHHQVSHRLNKILSVQSERLQKQKMAKSMRQSLIEDKQLDKISKLLVKDQIIQFREIEKQIKQKRALVQFAQKNWIQIFGLFLITEYIFSCLQEQRRKQKIAAKGKLLVWALKTKALIDVKEYGVNAKERTIFKFLLIQLDQKQNIKQNLQQLNLWIEFFFFLQSQINIKAHLIKLYLFRGSFVFSKLKRDSLKISFGNQLKKILLISFLIQEDKKKTNSFLKSNKQQLMCKLKSCNFSPTMNQVIDEYNKKQRVLWIEYIQHTYLEKDQKRKIHETALNLKEPKIYDLPNRNELSLLIEQYAKLKKLL